MSEQLRFTEEMKGFVTFGESSFERGYEHGRASDTDLMFHLTIEVDDVDLLAADPAREANARGYVCCEALGGRLTVEQGAVILFSADPSSRGRRMLYRLRFADGTSHPLTLSGFKRLDKGPATGVWPETTTLYTRLVQGHVDADEEPDAEAVASGILRIRPLDFLGQLTTFRASGTSARQQAGNVSRFGRLFLGELGSVYGPARPRRRRGERPAAGRPRKRSVRNRAPW